MILGTGVGQESSGNEMLMNANKVTQFVKIDK